MMDVMLIRYLHQNDGRVRCECDDTNDDKRTAMYDEDNVVNMMVR